MINIDITSDINKAMEDTDNLFWRDIPYLMARSINDTMFDVRNRIVNSTYQKAFNVRNRRYPGVTFKVTRGGDLNRRNIINRMKRELGPGGNTFLDVTQMVPHGNLELHSTGGVKKSFRGGNVAVPVGIGRTKTGRVPVAQKPKRVINRKNAFIVRGRGGTQIVKERTRKKGLRVWYVLTPQVRIKKRFRFYEDAHDTVDRVFSGHFNTQLNRVVSRSRFR